MRYGLNAFPSGGERRSSEREQILARRISDLGLKVEGTRMEKLVQRLHEELGAAGIRLRPPVYLSDEWGCPDRLPIIGVPFYLADQELTRIADEMMEGVEAETDDEILRYLRHEAGHAFNYAYKLYETEEWQAVFGPFIQPYLEEYVPRPFSHNYVRHLSGWYAQKHPDEDFAETFAVWLAPGSNWRELYQGWGCFTKLLYVDRVVRQFGDSPPLVTAKGYDVTEEALFSSVAEHYRRLRPQPGEIPPVLDQGLRDVFEPSARMSTVEGDGAEPAAEFVARHRRALVRRISHWSGLNDVAIRDLLDHIGQRCVQLGLRVRTGPEAALLDLTALVSTLSMNKLLTGEFVGK